MIQLNQGIFDDAPISVICLTTIFQIERESDRELDVRRFRPNIVVEASNSDPFAEDRWLGQRLSFGAGKNSPTVSVTMRDKRCVMINLDPDTAQSDASVMKAALRLNENNAGIYATVICTGELAVGQKVYLSK